MGLFQSTGMVSQTEFGPLPLSWVEIKAWNETLKLNLTSRELMIIKNMSNAYSQMQYKSKDPACIAPAYSVDEESLELKRSKISNAFKNLSKMMRKR